MTCSVRDRGGVAVGSVTQRLVLGCVVSNGGDRAILEAQIDILATAFGPGRTTVRDSRPDLAAGLVDGIEVLPLLRTTAAPEPVRKVVDRTRPQRMRLAVSQGSARHLLTAAERAIVESTRSADLVAFTGGTSLIEKYPLREKLAQIELALDLGRPVVLLPQSLGPFTDPDNQRAMRRISERARAIFVRDERSYRHLVESGCATDQVQVVPDVVFWLVDDAAVARLAGATTPAAPSVAISVRDCRNFFPAATADADQQRLERAFAELVVAITARGGSVTLVSTCQGVPEYWLDDSVVAARVFEALPDSVRAQVVLDRDFHPTAELRALLGRHDLTVSTRLHGAILSLCAGTPVLPIAYEFKTHEVFGQLGAAGDVIDIAEVTAPDRLATAFGDFLGGLDARRASLASKVGGLREELDRLPELLRAAVEPR